MNEYQKYLDLIKNFIVEQGDYVNANWSKAYVSSLHDDGIDVTTNFDQEVEKNFRQLIAEKYPDHGFLGEEYGSDGDKSDYVWQIDPIDGTKYFTKGIPLWGVTAALSYKDEPVAGIIYNPVSKQLYEASKGGGAFLNGLQLKVNPETDPKKIQISWDLTTWKYDWDKHQHKLSEITAQLMRTFYRIRMLGNGAYSLAWLAQGVYGAYVDPYRSKDKIVDIAAGLLLCKEAGADFTRIDLGDNMEQVIVAQPQVLDQIKQLIKF